MSGVPDGLLELWEDVYSTIIMQTQCAGESMVQLWQHAIGNFFKNEGGRTERELDAPEGAKEGNHIAVILPSALTNQLSVLAPALVLGGIPGFDIGVAGGSFLAMHDTGLLASPGMEAMVASASMLGSILMTSCVFLFEGTTKSNACDIAELSPRTRMICGACSYACGALVTASAPGASGVICGRVVSGLGLGLISIGAPQYLSEAITPSNRGQLFGVKQMLLTLLMLTGTSISMGTVMCAGTAAWRWIFDACSCVGFLGAASGAILLPESPRWLLLRCQPDAAAAAFAALHGSHASESEFAQMQAHVDTNSSGSMLHIRDLLQQPSLLPAVLIVIVTQLSGHPAMMVHLATILHHTGLSVHDTACACTGILVWKALSTAVVLPVVDSRQIGRYGLIKSGSAFLVLSLVGLAATQTAGFSTGVVSCLFLNASIFQASFGTLNWLLPSELLPNECRARGLALTRIVDYTCFAVTAGAFPILLAEFGYASPYIVAAGLTVFSAGPLLYLLPETANQSLEEVQEGYKHRATIRHATRTTQGAVSHEDERDAWIVGSSESLTCRSRPNWRCDTLKGG